MKNVVKIRTEYITLGQLIKSTGIVQNGADAKVFLSNNVFYVNGEAEQRRGRKIYPKMIVKFNDHEYEIVAEEK